jgi:triphosphoribosyl-dephospho-CoA synthase
MSDSGALGETSMPVAPALISGAAQLACLIEVTAPKPGNVSPGRDFGDTRYEDFLTSAAAIGPVMAEAGERSVGATVLAAVRATARLTHVNTNLGIVLLFAPLARAAISASAGSLRQRLSEVLDATTVEDARDVYAAIRLANPGGLGRVEAQDVGSEPTESLLEVMKLAANRDAVAREYATNYATTFDDGVPGLIRARSDGLDWSDATVETYLLLLAARPDTLIARKRGLSAAVAVSRGATAVISAGGVRSAAGKDRLAEFDLSLRDADNANNPGATADLTAATLFAALLLGHWHGGVGQRGTGPLAHPD